MRQRTNNYRVASFDDDASPTSRSDRLKRFHTSGAARAAAKLRALAARLWGKATPLDGAAESGEELARRQFCSGSSSQCVRLRVSVSVSVVPSYRLSSSEFGCAPLAVYYSFISLALPAQLTIATHTHTHQLPLQVQPELKRKSTFGGHGRGWTPT